VCRNSHFSSSGSPCCRKFCHPWAAGSFEQATGVGISHSSVISNLIIYQQSLWKCQATLHQRGTSILLRTLPEKNIMRNISSCDAEIRSALDMFHVCIPLLFIIIDISLLPSAVLCFNSHPQAKSGVGKKSTYWKWGSPCCRVLSKGTGTEPQQCPHGVPTCIRICILFLVPCRIVPSPCCICFTLSFYQSIFSYSFVFISINTVSTPCSSQFLHVFDRRNITWSHILSAITYTPIHLSVTSVYDRSYP